MSQVTVDVNFFGITAAAAPRCPKKFCPTRQDCGIVQLAFLRAFSTVLGS